MVLRRVEYYCLFCHGGQDEERRTNLRYLDICSVDPPGCTDIDDALHCRRLDNGNLEVRMVILSVLFILFYLKQIIDLFWGMLSQVLESVVL